jgi:TonB family protein
MRDVGRQPFEFEHVGARPLMTERFCTHATRGVTMKVSVLVLTLACASASSAAELPPSEMSKPLPEFDRTPLVEDYYPATSRLLGEHGAVKLRLCYDERGRVTASTLEQSSTFKRIDQAALRMGRAYRIKPNVINGQPQPGCAVVPVEFSLEEPVSPADRGEGQSSTRPTLPLGPLPPPPPPPPPGRSIPLPANPPPRFIPLISRVSKRGYTESDSRVVGYWAQ